MVLPSAFAGLAAWISVFGVVSGLGYQPFRSASLRDDAHVAAAARANSSRGHARTTRKHGLDEVAIGLVSGRPEYWDSLHEAVLQYTPKGAIIEAKGMCECSFRAGFKALQEAQPDAEWYYIGDEDAFIYLDRLEELLSQYDSSVPTFMASLGHSTVYERTCGSPSPIPGTGNNRNWHTFYGGTGFIASSALVKEVDFGKSCKHITHAADRDVTCLIGDSWKSTYLFVELSVVQNSGNKEANLHKPQVVVHHLAAEEIAKMGKEHHVHLSGDHDLKKVSVWHNYGSCAPDWGGHSDLWRNSEEREELNEELGNGASGRGYFGVAPRAAATR